MTTKRVVTCKNCHHHYVGEKCPACNHPTYELSGVLNQKKSTTIAPLGIIAFLVTLSFALLLTVGKSTPLGSTLLSALSGGDNRIVPVSAHTPPPTLWPTATLPAPEEALPKEIHYIVDKCLVEGSDADRVTCFKSEMRQVGDVWLTQFQADDGTFIQESFPSFNGLDFLLVCFPKELGPSWAETYGEAFFVAIGSHPIDPVTGKENPETIAEGFWLFANPEKFRHEPTAFQPESPTATMTPSPYPTETRAPTLPPPTSTPVVEEVRIATYIEVSFEDLAYNRNLGSQVWDNCDGSSLTFRQSNSWTGYIEAACPSFENPKVHVERVTGLGESYTVYWPGSGGTWFVRGGVMSLGNTGGPNYSWTNSLGINLYSVGFGKVTITPVQLFAPTETPPPPPPPEVEPTATSWNPEVGCISLTWNRLTADAQAVVNEMGDSIMIRRADGKWFANNNPNRCYTLSGLPGSVTNLDDGRIGTWNLTTGSTINLVWLDSSYEYNPFIWRVSNYVWVGMVDPQ